MLLLLCVLLCSDDLVPMRLPAGGGEAPTAAVACLDPISRTAIRARLAQNRADLRQRGMLQARGQRPDFIWPLRAAPGVAIPTPWAITNFVDHDPDFPDALSDYQGGTRTYDTMGGYNHRGADYLLWPFSWRLMDEDAVLVVAAAAGTIIDKDDGNFDRNCSLPSPNPSWNAVYVEHADGSIAWYGHLKNGSLTEVPVGGTVAAGDVLGVVGSSGNSSGPHLHFEVYDAGDNLIDPYAGPFNTLNDESWWVAQDPYRQPRLLHAMTHDAPPEINGFCPEEEIINEADHFQPLNRIYFSVWLRDQLQDVPIGLEIIQPDGNQYTEWSYASPWPALSSAWWYWFFDFPDWAQVGVWQFRADFEGETVVHHFTVGDCGDQYDTALAGWPVASILDLVNLLPCQDL